jgi:NADPH2:quinone reductase
MPRAIVVNEFGGSEVLQIQEVSLAEPGPDEVLIRHKAIGINFYDVRARRGDMNSSLPFTPGCEACGVIEKVGENVVEFKVGDRVAYATIQFGAYAEARIINKKYLVLVPDWIDDETAAAVLLKGMTAYLLLRRTFMVSKKNTVLIHAAAGGVGQFMCRLAKYYGAKVIGVVGSQEKKNIVESLGVDYVISRDEEDFVQRVLEYTNGEGVHVVYDSVGLDTLESSIQCLSVVGLLVSFGSSSGEPNPIPLSSLAQKCLFLTRFVLFVYAENREDLVLTANEVFTLAEQGIFQPNISHRYSFDEIPRAHEELESRSTTGQGVIICK